MELYIHIPFCVKKCRYCDFLSFAGKEACFKDYITALCAELDSYGQLIRERGLDTIFIGGGTPSILPVDIMEILLKKVDGLIAESGVQSRNAGRGKAAPVQMPRDKPPEHRPAVGR